MSTRRFSASLAVFLALGVGVGSPALADTVKGDKNVIVLRVYFSDKSKTSRYSKTQVNGFFDHIEELWGKHSSHDTIKIIAQVNDDLIKLPGKRSDYIDDHNDGDTSDGDKYGKVLTDAIAASTGFDWSKVSAVMVVMAETDTAQFHRGQGNRCNLPMGPGSSNTPLVGCAIFSENPNDSDPKVWGRWAHELGHAFQLAGPPHPSNYNSNFEQMDANYPGQTGMFEQQTSTAFGWMPDAKYQVVTKATGGRQVTLWAQEHDPAGKPNVQAVKAYLGNSTGSGSPYYLISARHRVLGDDLNDRFSPAGIPDEGVLIERVVPNGDPQVTLQGKGGDRDKAWHKGDLFTNAGDGIFIAVADKLDDENYVVAIRYADRNNRPDVGLNSWRAPPGNTYETTDIWVDSPVNGYGVFRYGSWSDLSGGTVPRGNGDDPAIGQVNRLSARVRNYGTATASNVVVHFDVTDPLGLGIDGSSGFKEAGKITAAQFPGLASLAPEAFVDVYLEWTPSATLTAEQIAAGAFAFHSCVRVRIDHQPNETVFGNQDGDGQQENISTFEAPAGMAGAPNGAPSNTTMVHLRNDSKTVSKFFNLAYDPAKLAPGWTVSVNDGKFGVQLAPNERREFPVTITPAKSLPAGSVASVKLFATSTRKLVNDKNPADTHQEFKELGGLVIEGHAVDKTRLRCEARRVGSSVAVTGRLDLPESATLRQRLTVMLNGAEPGPSRGGVTLMPQVTGRAAVAQDGTFRGVIDRGANLRAVACMFAGTDTLGSALVAPVAVR